MSLIPILLAGYGRSGTTALMELLGRDRRVAFDRTYPFEYRYLTYWTKLAALAGSFDGPIAGSGTTLCDYRDGRVSRFPWTPSPVPAEPASLNFAPDELLGLLWGWAGERLRRAHPGATHYAEKAPHWLPAAIAGVTPCRVIHLTRDPRDVFLSARAFNRRRGRTDFGAPDNHDDVGHARALAHALLAYVENRSDGPDPHAIAVRYEDFVHDPAAESERLGRALGLDFAGAGAGAETPADHRTTDSPEASVGRWKRESLTTAARLVLERHLATPMAAAGYEVPTGVLPPVELDLSTGGNASADGSLVPRPGGGWDVNVAGPDFWIELDRPEIRAAELSEIWICATGGRGDRFSVYWRGRREGFAEPRSVHTPYRPGRHWEVVRLGLAGHALWKGTIAGLRLDLFNGDGTAGRGVVRWVRLVD